MVLTAMGDLPGAEAQWQAIVREVPSYRPGWHGLGEALLQQQRLADADRLADELLMDPHVRVEGHLLKSRVERAKKQIAEARGALETAIAEYPADLGTVRESGDFFFHHGTDEEGEQALRALLARDPIDATAYHSLGVVLMRNGRHEEAVVAYRQSLRYRPNYGPTFFNLSYALTDGNRLTEARAACEQAVRLLPNDPGPRRELARIAPWLGAFGCTDGADAGRTMRILRADQTSRPDRRNPSQVVGNYRFIAVCAVLTLSRRGPCGPKCLQASRRRPAVDHEDLAGDERGFVRSKEKAQAADVVGLAQPRDRLLAQELLAPCLVLPEIGAEVGLDQAGGEGVDADAMRCRTRAPRIASS